jgi:hypothetical protein
MHCSYHLQGEISGVIYRSWNGSTGQYVEHAAIQLERATWLRRRVGGKEGQSDFAKFIFVFTVEVVGLFYFNCFPDVGMVSPGELSRQRLTKPLSLSSSMESLILRCVVFGG